MFLLLIVCLLPIAILGIYLFISNNRKGEFFSNHPNMPIVAVVIALIPILFLCLFAIINLPQSFNGFCEIPPDLSQPCTYFEYLIFSMSPSTGWNFFGYLIFCSIEIAWASAVFGLTAFYVKHVR